MTLLYQTLILQFLTRSIPIGEVVVDDVKKSITRETVDKFIKDVDVGIGLTNLQTDLETQAHTFQTKIDHGLNRVVKVSIASSGDGYGTGANADFYNAKLVGIGTSTTGFHATAKVTVDATGGLTDVTVMDGVVRMQLEIDYMLLVLQRLRRLEFIRQRSSRSRKSMTIRVMLSD